jgi:hypothetical protein
MDSHSCLPYRGYTVDLVVKTSRAPPLDGEELRYSVSWSIRSEDPCDATVVSSPEQLNFPSPDAACTYGERQAQRFIDTCVDDPSMKKTET